MTNKLTRLAASVAAILALAAGCKTNSAPPTPPPTRPAMVRSQIRATHPAAPRSTNLPRLTTAAPLPQLRGVNLTGGEMDYGTANVTSPASGTDYLFVSHQDIDYLASRGVSFARLIFSWEGVEPNGVNTPLATSGNNGTYVSTLVDRVNYATSKGVYVMVEPHGASSGNFARYKGNLVGSAAVPNSAFAYFWTQVANLFKGNPLVGFGLSNEPHDMSTVQWFQAAQAAVQGIRSTGATNTIYVPGNDWTAAESWTSSWYDTASPQVSNATAWQTYVKDPLNNCVITVHSYFDSTGGGGGTDIVSPTIEVDRVSVVVNWARPLGLRVHVSEFGAANTSASQTAVSNWLVYEAQNTDVLTGWSWWAYGPPAWWGGYEYTLDPTANYTVDAPQMAWLKPYFVPVTPPSPTDAGTADAGQTDAGADSGVADAGTDAGSDAGTLLPFYVSAKVTFNNGQMFCKQWYFKNPNTVARSWKTMTVYLKDGTLAGSNSVWGGTTPNLSATGTVIVTAPGGSSSIPAGANPQTVGMCVYFGASKYVATSGGVSY